MRPSEIPSPVPPTRLPFGSTYSRFRPKKWHFTQTSGRDISASEWFIGKSPPINWRDGSVTSLSAPTVPAQELASRPLRRLSWWNPGPQVSVGAYYRGRIVPRYSLPAGGARTGFLV